MDELSIDELSVDDLSFLSMLRFVQSGKLMTAISYVFAIKNCGIHRTILIQRERVSL